MTRLFTIAHGYHFAFLAISLALLGFGASGTALALRPQWSRDVSGVRLARVALLGSVSLLGGYLVANFVPFDPYRIASEGIQLLFLVAYLLALAAPFFVLGLVPGLALTASPDRSGRLYSAILIGSALGCLLALVALSVASGPTAVVLAAFIAACASLAFAGSGSPRGDALAATAVLVPLALLLWQTPAFLDLRLSAYKPLSQLLSYPGTRVLHRESSPLSQLDVVESRTVRSAPGLSLTYQGHLPRQLGVVVDGDTVLPLTSRQSLTPAFLDALPTSLAYRLRPRPRLLIFEPGGGLDVLLALEKHARSVVAVEEDPSVVDLIRSRFGVRAGAIYSDPRVRVIETSPRPFLARAEERFDVIELALAENFRPVTAGAFSLTESYLLTREGSRALVARLAPGGLLVVHRWLQLPPTEELRTAGLIVAALEHAGASPRRSVAAVRSFSTMLILAKREPLTVGEIRAIKAFARKQRFDLVYHPGIRRADANRFNVLRHDRYFASFQRLLANPERFYDDYEYDIAPPTDDRPFFFHFFKWEQTPDVLRLLGKTWQPFGGAGYLIVLALLLLAAVLSLVLIAVPVAVILRRSRQAGAERGGWLSTSVYFGGLGLGFLLIEVALVQRFIVFLEQPAYSLAVVLFGLLVFSGLGSALSARMHWRAALAALVVAASVYPWLLSTTFSAFLAEDFTVRVLVALLVLAPLGFLMGVPFPRGLASLGERAPSWLPLAWGVNGFASVIGAILAAVVALSWGFGSVFFCAAVSYLLALAVLGRPTRAPGPG